MRVLHVLQATAVVASIILANSNAVCASGAANLSRGQIAGVVVGSVGGALLLCFAALLMYCLCTSRRLQTVDFVWSGKPADMEAMTTSNIRHQRLSGPCTDDLTSCAQRTTGTGSAAVLAAIGTDASDAAAGANRTDGSTWTGEDTSYGTFGDAAVDKSTRPKYSPTSRSPATTACQKGAGFFPSRSWGRLQAGGGGAVDGSGVQLFMVPKGIFRHIRTKDKDLQVSRSTRVETSAQVELAEPFQPAATNMGPPLSKSSMLLRWLNGAEDGLSAGAAAAAAQLAAAVAIPSGVNGVPAHDGVCAAAAGGRDSSLLDCLPLLSLAAQQTGIVFSKMPPSVLSSPAVSMAENTSVHMLRGNLKRSDALSSSLPALDGHFASQNAAAFHNNWHDADDRYPASLTQASVQSGSDHGAHYLTTASISGSGCNSSRRPGIVFDYVKRSTRSMVSSRTNTTGGAPVAVTIQDHVGLPVSTNGGIADPMLAVAETLSLPPIQPIRMGVGADDAFALGPPPDEHFLAKALRWNSNASSTPPSTAANSSSGEYGTAATLQRHLWLHQTPPVKLTALQEADVEDDGSEAELSSNTRPRPPGQVRHSVSSQPPQQQQLAPVLQQVPAVCSWPEGLQRDEMTHGSMPLHAWTQVSDRTGPLVSGSSTAALAAAASVPPSILSVYPVASTVAADDGIALALAFATVNGPIDRSYPLSLSTSPAGAVFASVSRPADKEPLVMAAAMVPATPPSLGHSARSSTDAASASAISSSRPSDYALVVEVGTTANGTPVTSPLLSLTQLQRRPGPIVPPLLPSQSGSSFRSQTSLVSPSLSIHYPELQDSAM